MPKQLYEKPLKDSTDYSAQKQKAHWLRPIGYFQHDKHLHTVAQPEIIKGEWQLKKNFF